ncbi:MAG: ABC transporter ATP-binding protein [Candidatus Nanopelagicales bacterium]
MPARRGPFGGGGGPGMGMAPSMEKAHDFQGSIRRLLSMLAPERGTVVIVLALGSISVFLMVLGPKILGNATNVIFDGIVSQQLPAGTTQEQAVAQLQQSGQGQLAELVASLTLTPGQGVDFGLLARWLALAVVVYSLGSALSWAQNYLMASVTQRTMYRLREEVDFKLGRLPLSYFDSTPRGDLLSRVTNDIDNITMTLQQTLTQFITSVLTVIGVLAMMVWISPILAVISILTVPATFGATMLIARRSKPHFVEQWKWTGALNSTVEETYTGHEIVRVFGYRNRAYEIFEDSNERMYQASYRAQFISGMIQPASMFIANLNYVAIAVFGGLRVASGQMSLGDVQAFIQYSRQFTMPITQIASVTNLLQSGAASAERVFALLDEPEQAPEPDDPQTIPAPARRVDFENVDFRYVPDKPLIHDLTFHADPGQTVAIVGPTGAGKTTLVNLLMRFYDIDGGRILIDGINTEDATREDVRSCFGMVLQDTWLFEGTVYDNIAYGAANPTEDDVHRAARASFAEHFIQTLPEGFQTRLTEDGANISAGERQLLTIARAFLADPAILVLDEATSSVDTRTEVLLQRAMAELRRGRTSFVIAHRLSTIRDADLILVMDNGRIVEQGSHEVLMAAGGAYRDLYESQFTDAFE